MNALHGMDRCYQFRVPRNLRIDIKDRLEEYSQSIEIDIHDCTQTQKSQLPPCLRFGFAPLIHVNQDYSRLPTDLVFNLFWIRQLGRLSTYTRSSSISSFRSTLSTTQTGTTIFRRASGSCPSFRYINCTSDFILSVTHLVYYL